MRLRLPLTGLSGLPLELALEGERLKGVLRQENPVLGLLELPFASRLEGNRLKPLPLPPPSLRVAGRLWPGEGGAVLELELSLSLPPGEKWGERAFGRILEGVFFLLLERALSQGARPPV
ncbi:hypothetical protein GCM10007092_04760 [Thermus composti]|uniref:DUF3809 family protein n=1 Tax=Thermus composti TaxID=532059 RepID=A0ABV6Q4W6_9DEIN|nr:DUF3809 family protein [Thermus composti]GGM94502.1 hypothetical protein GCM10007092_04760 [Thermus composti]